MPPSHRLAAQEESGERTLMSSILAQLSSPPHLHHAWNSTCHAHSRALRYASRTACASSRSLHDIIGAHWRTFCRSFSGVMADRNWGTCGKTQLCVSDEWLGLLSLPSLPAPPSTVTPPSFLFAGFLNGIQMQKLYFAVLCVVPSGVCQSRINEDNDVPSLAFLPLLPPASPCSTKKKRRTRILRGVGTCQRGVSVTSAQSLALFPLQLRQVEQASAFDDMHCVSAWLNRVGW